jgi:hypothetical protein
MIRLSPYKPDSDQFMMDIAMLKRLAPHPNLAKSEYCPLCGLTQSRFIGQCTHTPVPKLVMELFSLGNLRTFLRKVVWMF